MNKNGKAWRRDSFMADEMKQIYPRIVPEDQLVSLAHCHSYQLGDKIGEGSFGKVFKAIHTKSNTVVAFKFIFKV